jgi:hypothetical protein
MRYTRSYRWLPLAALVAAAALAAGCGNVENRIAEISARHGVTLDVTAGARAQNFLGGNTYAVVDNVGKELQALPYLATAGRRIHVADTGDLLRSAYPEEYLDALLAGAATQDHPGPDLGDVYVLNKNLWGLYVDAFQPGTQGLYDPRLRHEIMHAIEIDSLRDLVLAAPWQTVLDESGEMVYRMGVIDSLALSMPVASPDDAAPPVATPRHQAYLDLCARWLAAHFGDVTGDGRLDDADVAYLRTHAAAFLMTGHARLTYEDAAVRGGPAHSLRRGADVLTQIEMTAGLAGYRPQGFASPYGRTAPWEDKAEVLDYAIREKLIPNLYAAPGSTPGVTVATVAAAQTKLDRLRRNDALLARKVEILAIFFGNLTPPESRGTTFVAQYGGTMVPFDALCGTGEDPSKVAAARREALVHRVEASPHRVRVEGTVVTVSFVGDPQTPSKLGS